MKPSVAARLLRLNREFYTRFADSFAGSRAVLNPGIARAVESVRAALGGRIDSVLDVGCGDGRVGRAFEPGVLGPPPARYVGVDESSALLARAALLPLAAEQGGSGPPLVSSAVGRRDWGPSLSFLRADLSRPGWSAAEEVSRGGFDLALCLAVLHHIPGPVRRLRLLREIGELLRAGGPVPGGGPGSGRLPGGRPVPGHSRPAEHLHPGGCLVVSVWRFTHSERLRRKIVPWEEIGLTSEDVDPGDALVDWRRGGRGLRYVHEFEEEELMLLCHRSGYEVRESFVSDGAGGDLSRYVVLVPAPVTAGGR